MHRTVNNGAPRLTSTGSSGSVHEPEPAHSLNVKRPGWQEKEPTRAGRAELSKEAAKIIKKSRESLNTVGRTTGAGESKTPGPLANPMACKAPMQCGPK